jgi:hypothetical protein
MRQGFRGIIVGRLWFILFSKIRSLDVSCARREMAVAISPIKAEKQGAPDNLSLALSLSESQAVTKFVSQSGVVVRQILTDTRELRDVCGNR